MPRERLSIIECWLWLAPVPGSWIFRILNLFAIQTSIAGEKNEKTFKNKTLNNHLDYTFCCSICVNPVCAILPYACWIMIFWCFQREKSNSKMCPKCSFSNPATENPLYIVNLIWWHYPCLTEGGACSADGFALDIGTNWFHWPSSKSVGELSTGESPRTNNFQFKAWTQQTQHVFSQSSSHRGLPGIAPTRTHEVPCSTHFL